MAETGALDSGTGGRRVRLREAPDYPLARAAEAIASGSVVPAEQALEVADQVALDEAAEPLKLFDLTD